MNYCLVFLDGPTPGASAPLDPALEMTIGRDTTRDIPIDDHQASRLHARLTWDGATWRIEDCQSRNGTSLNGQTIDRAVLAPGDLLRIGDRSLVFLRESEETNTAIGLRPSVLAASTRMSPIDAAQVEAFISKLSSADSPAGKSLQTLYRFTETVQAASRVEQLVATVQETVELGTAAKTVTVLLADVNGRLQVAGSRNEEVCNDSLHMLARVAFSSGQAVTTEVGSSGTSDGSGNEGRGSDAIIAAPVFTTGRPRGAIECVVQTGQSFDDDDLDWVVAIARQFGVALENVERRRQLESANEALRQRVAGQRRIVGDSEAVRQLLDQIGRVATANTTVLVTGESGTGKELIAEMIHELSPRSAGPLVAVNCAAFSDSLLESELFGHEAGAFTGADRRRAGQFERADGGTLFLDEVGELTIGCQAKLLRILEGHPFQRVGGEENIQVNVRIVAATHRDLKSMVDAGDFREDLFFRLRVIELTSPPLRRPRRRRDATGV